MWYRVLKIYTASVYISVDQQTCFRFSTERFCRESAVWSLYNTAFVMNMSSPFVYAQVSDRTINQRLSRYNIIIHLSLRSVPFVKSACKAQHNCQMAHEKPTHAVRPLAIFCNISDTKIKT
jgi:hypothetical protein